MKHLFCLLLLLGGCDDSQSPMCFGVPVAAGVRCCPFDFPNFPTGMSCSPVGDSCWPGASDVACVCESSGWVCHPTLRLPDLSFPVSD